MGKTGVSPGIFYCEEVSWSALEPPRVPVGGVGLIHPLPPGHSLGCGSCRGLEEFIPWKTLS